jgi:hypothetical protein
MGRWGEKVPAAVGTVAERLSLPQLCALDLERALLAAEGTRPPAFGTGLVLAQRLGLLFEERLQGALGQAGGGGLGNLLHGREIDVESGSVVPEGASGDDFAPLRGEVAEFLKFLGGEGAACHAASCVGVEARTKEKVAPVRLWRST